MFKRIEKLMSPEEVASTAGPGSEATVSAETPVVAPVEPPVVDNAGGDAPQSVDWDAEASAMDADDDLTEAPVEVEVKPDPVAAPVVPVAPVTTPVPAVAAVPAAAPVVAPVAAPVVAPVAAPVAQTPEQIEAARVAAATTAQAEEAKILENLVTHYALPEDMAMQLQTEPEKVLPFLAARIHQNIAKGLTQVVQQLMPAAISGVLEYRTKEEAAKKTFFEAWPSLVGKEREVLEAGRIFRQLNPTATAEEAIQRIGRTVADALGIQVSPVATGPGTVATPAAVAAPQAVFTPAGGGGSGRGAPAPSDNIFTALADELLEDDR